MFIRDAHIMIERAKSSGVALSAAGRKSMKGFDLIENSSSIVDTFKVVIRRRYQRYWTKATPSAALRKKPKVFAKIFEAVVM